MIVLIIILCLILLLSAVLLFRTWTRKPTAAKNAKVTLDTSERSVAYGKKLARMVQKETISSRFEADRTKFYEFHEILEELFPNVHRVCEKHDFQGSLLYKWKGKSDQAPILLMSHQDVVEAGGAWQHDPFSGDIDEDGRVWGRGTVDTKASLFCIFTALEELIQEGYQPEVDVYIGSSCTEEWSGDGAPSTVEYLKEHGIHLALVLDEGGMILEEPVGGVKGTYAMVGLVEKGYGDVKFTARGNGGHASAPGKDTPLVRLGKFMADVEKHSPFIHRFSDTLEEMFYRMTPNMDFGMKLIFSNLWLFRPILLKLLPSISPAAGAMLHTTLAFTTAKGSDGLNVLPQEAYVTGNMRFMHHQSNEESIEAVRRIANKYHLETEVIYQDSPCPIVDFRGSAFKMIEETVEEIYPGVETCPYIMTGGTDAKYYGAVCDNCIRFAPLYIDVQQYGSVHALNENIYQGALPMGVDFYKKVIQKSKA